MCAVAERTPALQFDDIIKGLIYRNTRNFEEFILWHDNGINFKRSLIFVISSLKQIFSDMKLV